MHVEVGGFLGPERSLLIINGGSAPAVAWKWKRQKVKETHVWVSVALTTGVCFGHQASLTLGKGRNPHWSEQGSLLATFPLFQRQ